MQVGMAIGTKNWTEKTVNECSCQIHYFSDTSFPHRINIDPSCWSKGSLERTTNPNKMTL